jgi:hypothetical protein
MRAKSIFFLLLPILAGCHIEKRITEYGRHYQQYSDYKSLQKVVRLISLPTDTTYIQTVLGAPENYGFDYRYYTDSTSLNKCPVGAVFHINANGKIDSKWIDEICE